MSQFIDFPTCYVCRSIELEIVTNDEFGPVTLCGECGYSWIAKFEDFENKNLLETTILQSIAS